MRRYLENIIDYVEDRLSTGERRKFEADLKCDKDFKEQYLIFEQINTYMRARFDIEEVRYDPVRTEIDTELIKAVEEYTTKPGDYNNFRSFITENTEFYESENVPEEEIHQIETEINEYGIDEISEGWVRSWLAKNEGQRLHDPVTDEIRSFVKKSFDDLREKDEFRMDQKHPVNKRVKTLIFRAGLAAAVITAVFLLLKITILSGDPDTLYRKFYQSFDVITPVTRNYSSEPSNQFRQAVELYKSGNYISADSAFSIVFNTDSSFIAPRFMSGIIHMELADFNQAVSSFEYVISQSGEYSKEAMWYLGLAYLKIREMNKARECFYSLTLQEGYYKERAAKLLRRLK